MSRKPNKFNHPSCFEGKDTSFSTLLDVIDPEREAQRQEYLNWKKENAPKASPKKTKKSCKPKVNLRANSKAKLKKNMSFEEKLARTQKWLQETFPTLFDPAHPKALDIHIIRDIKAHYKNERTQRKYPDDLVIKAALYCYIESPGYLGCLVEGAPRYNMYGKIVGVVETAPQATRTP